ncbi:MAG TPA: hypothetical protein VMU02_02760 [bacterium]|nr:hypothetical protein [bacterium]
MHRRAVRLITGLALLGGVVAFASQGRTAEAERVSAKPEGPTVQKAKPAPPAKAPERWDPARAREEYRLLQFELALAKSGQLYLVFDVGHHELDLKVKGTVVWSCPIQLASGSEGDLDSFVKRFREGDRLARLVTSKYLFAGAERTPDSILAIVGQVVKADPHSLQRDLPERFQISWGWNLVLEVRTDIVGLPASSFRNARLAVLESVRRPFGETRLVIKMTPEQALTLYRAASPGLPTAVYALP